MSGHLFSPLRRTLFLEIIFLLRQILTKLSFSISIFMIFHSRVNTSVKNNIDDEITSEHINESGRRPEPRPWYFQDGELRPSPEEAESLKLWPEEAKDDRILDQLMFVTKNKAQSVKKIYLTKLQNLIFEEGSQIFNDLNCPMKSCEIVFNEKAADALIFENFIDRLRAKSSSHQVWILHSLESPYMSGKAVQQTSVNWTASYRTDSDLVTPYDKWVYYDDNQKVALLRKNYAARKSRKVAWMVSNCRSKNKRLEYGRSLGRYISVDVYGACGNRFCVKDRAAQCRHFISKHYKFYLSFENANCRDYITEKFYLNGLRLDVVPIVMGAPKEDYEKVAPQHSFIHVEDFPSPKHLAAYLHYLDKNDEAYNAYFMWKGAGEFINTYFLCRVCAMLHADRKNHFYQKITDWWRNKKICTKTFWNETNREQIERHLRNETIPKR